MSSNAIRPSIFLLIVFTAVSQIGAVMHTPSIPAMATAFEAGPLAIQLTMTLYLIGYAVAQLFVGALSDALGRRIVMLVGLAVFAAASLACALAPNIEVMIGLRFLQAAGACVGLVVTRAIIRDCFDPSQTTRYMAYMGMAVGLMPALSPSVGGLLQTGFGWSANFVAMGIVGIAALAASAGGLRETLPVEARRTGGVTRMLDGFRTLLTMPVFLAYTSAIAISTAMFFVYLSAGPIVVQQGHGIAPSTYGFIAMTMPCGFITGNYVSSRISPRIGLRRGTIVGYLIKGLSCALLLAFSHWLPFSIPVYVLPMLILGFGAGFVTSCGYSGVVQGDPSMAGTASGLSGLLQMATSALATVAVGLFDQISYPAYALLQTALAALGLAVFLLIVPRHPVAADKP